MKRRVFFSVLFIAQCIYAMPNYTMESVSEGYRVCLTVPDVILDRVAVKEISYAAIRDRT